MSEIHQGKSQKKKKYKYTPEQLAIADEYCRNDMSKLKSSCYPIFKKFVGGIDEKDYDDLFSLGLEVLTSSIQKYTPDKNCKFHTFFCRNFTLRCFTYLRNTNKEKRSNTKTDKNGKKIFSKDASLDAVGDNGKTLGETLDSGNSIEKSFEDSFNSLYMSENVEAYLSRLSRKQQQIVILLANKHKRNEILEILHISLKDYNEHLRRIKSESNVKYLYYKKGR